MGPRCMAACPKLRPCGLLRERFGADIATQTRLRCLKPCKVRLPITPMLPEMAVPILGMGSGSFPNH